MSGTEAAGFELRPLDAADLAPLRALFNRQVAPAPGWTEAGAAATWMQGALGDRSRVAVRGGAVIGAVGSVVAPPWLHVFPLIADEPAVAARLLEAGIETGRAAATGPVTTIRCGVRAGEEAKRAALVARGFAPSIEFVDLARAPAGDAGRDGPAGLTRVGQGALDREEARALHDLTFAELDNTAPLDAGDFNAGSLALHRATGFVERGRRRMYDLVVGG